MPITEKMKKKHEMKKKKMLGQRDQKRLDDRRDKRSIILTSPDLRSQPNQEFDNVSSTCNFWTVCFDCFVDEFQFVTSSIYISIFKIEEGSIFSLIFFCDVTILKGIIGPTNCFAPIISIGNNLVFLKRMSGSPTSSYSTFLSFAHGNLTGVYLALRPRVQCETDQRREYKNARLLLLPNFRRPRIFSSLGS